MRRLIILSLLMITTLAAHSSPHQNLIKVGSAKLKVLFWDIYYSELFSQSGQFVDGEYPVALKIEYLRDISAADLLERTVDEWDRLDVSQKTYQPWITQLQSIWPDINNGDTLTLVIDKSATSEFYYNGQAIGKLHDPAFGGAFLDIWLNENSSYPAVRNQLLGKL